MIVNVNHISRAMFKRLNFQDDCILSKGSYAYISIYGHGPDESTAPEINDSLWIDGIQLQFDDVDQPIHNLLPFSKDQANQIIDFVCNLHDLYEDIELIIHCYAGISRSAAVARFVNEILHLDLQKYNHLQLYNRTVYRVLFDEFFGSLKDQYQNQESDKDEIKEVQAVCFS